MTLQCHRFSNAASFLDAAGGFLLAHEAENTILLGAAAALRLRTPRGAAFYAVRDDVHFLFAASLTPPFPLCLSMGDIGGLPALISALRDEGAELQGVIGEPSLAQAFADAWTAGRAMDAETTMTMHLHKLTEVADLPPVPGALRPARADEAEWIADWFLRFVEEVELSPAEAQGARERIAHSIAEGRVFVWEDNGVAETIAGIRPTGPNGDAGRINLVRTRPEARGRGYGTATVAALSRRQLALGWRYCLIITDDRSPITNKIYPRVGYRRIGSLRSIDFRTAT